MAKQEKKGAYGMVYQDITRNNSLPLAAKGLYAYLAAFCGTSDRVIVLMRYHVSFVLQQLSWYSCLRFSGSRYLCGEPSGET